MGLFTPDHGNYEVTYKANSVPGGWENIKSAVIIVEADDLGDARRRAERQLRSAGYRFVRIESAKLIKHTAGSVASNERKKDNTSNFGTNTRYYSSSNGDNAPYTVNIRKSTNKSKFKKWAFIIPLIVVAIIIAVFVGNVFRSMSVEGTYYLKSIEGNVACSANSDENYCVLKDGVCTLYFTLTQPAGSSVHTFNYDGNKTTNIEFEKSNISMNWDDCIVIEFDYGNGQYNTFTYEKKEK